MQNQHLDFLRTRRSVRSFLPKPVEESLIQTILECAMVAPSAMNQQPWEFYVTQQRSVLDKLSASHPGAKPFTQAQLGIVVVLRTQEIKAPGFVQQDGAAAVMNILYSAHAQGLGAVWCGIHPLADREEKVREIMNIPADLYPFACIALGYPDQTLDSVDRFSQERIHWV